MTHQTQAEGTPLAQGGDHLLSDKLIHITVDVQLCILEKLRLGPLKRCVQPA